MFYDFPVGLTLDEVRRVTKAHNARCGMDTFIEKDCGDHSIFNYLVAFSEAFPQPDTDDTALNREYAILRECRGLIISRETGEVLARRFHKFFNVNEKPFTQAHLIDWSYPHVIMDKLDGSMITPFVTGGQIRWGTKMGITDQALQVEEFLRDKPEYTYLAEREIAQCSTPIFEWCSRKQKIVIDYPEDQLVLTAIRDNLTGEYASQRVLDLYGEEFGIPVCGVSPGSVEDPVAFIEHTRGLKNAEGYVVRFTNGHMLKAKAEEYCLIHGTKDKLQFEKDVWALVLNDLMDDAMAFMDDADRDRCERFVAAMNQEIAKTAGILTEAVDRARIECQDDKKQFATVWVKQWPTQTQVPLLFSIWGGHDASEAVRNYLKKHLSSGPRLEIARPMVNGLTWDDYRDRNVVLDD